MESVNELRFKCQKPGEWDRLNTYHKIYRLISIRITRVFLMMGITANHVSLTNIFLVLLSGVFLVKGGVGNSLFGVFLLFVVSIFDRVDGEIARYRNTVGPIGDYIDNVMHLLYKIVFFGAIGTSLYLSTNNVWFLLAGFLTVSFSLANNITSSEVTRLTPPAAQNFNTKSKITTTMSKISKLISLPQALMKEIFIVAVLLGLSNVFLILYAIYIPLYWVAFTFVSSKRFL